MHCCALPMGMRKELLTVTLLLILGVPYGLQQETEIANQTQRSVEQECPTWFVPQSNQTGDCKCGVRTFFSRVVVKCEEHSNQSMILSRYCMTYYESTGVTVIGGCPYNEFMCGGLNRT